MRTATYVPNKRNVQGTTTSIFQPDLLIPMAIFSAVGGSRRRLDCRLVFAIVIAILLPCYCTGYPSLQRDSCFAALYAFGDSYTDTGNFVRAIYPSSPVGRLPYGETFFRRPTGRASDGRLVVDFLAEALGLPLLPPYLAERSTAAAEVWRRGACFAVGWSAAMDAAFFRELGLKNLSWTGLSLAAQLQLFQDLQHSLTPEPGYRDMMSNSLFLVGEFGVNDYQYFLFLAKNVTDVYSAIPNVTSTISMGIKDLIRLGARTLIVPGVFPLGCLPNLLTLFKSERDEDYEPRTGCLKFLNELSTCHNLRLQEELDRLRELHPEVAIIYADYYGAATEIFNFPKKFGFKTPLTACCGGGEGPYNYSPLVNCGDKGSKVCDDPSQYVSWDGIHLTEAASEIVARGVLEGLYAVPSVAETCSSFSM
ncbi:GDSL esterase/lipase [Ananas comosus]|uniref:GDSL esterase/lipase n=1 Tax=Ananas comosus TaxID=4615 RepID=A0A199UGJ8_ANACO|nr:GDSL esterase/lipase [Ananas comosus]